MNNGKFWWKNFEKKLRYIRYKENFISFIFYLYLYLYIQSASQPARVWASQSKSHTFHWWEYRHRNDETKTKFCWVTFYNQNHLVLNFSSSFFLLQHFHLIFQFLCFSFRSSFLHLIYWKSFPMYKSHRRF